MHIERCVVAGPGLLGASTALAVMNRLPQARVAVWGRRRESVEDAVERGFAHEGHTDFARAVAGADLIVLCTPVGAMHALAEIAAHAASADCVVTDVGSVKGRLVRALEAVLGGRYVGAHPMAGSEKHGMEAAREDLYDGAVCIITPTSSTQPSARDFADAFWRVLGCRTVQMDPDVHDCVVARISHLPHLAAACITRAAAAAGTGVFGSAGGGFRDSTRIAAAPPAMWTEILLENRPAVLESLSALERELAEARHHLEAGAAAELLTFLEKARDLRLNIP